jgi:hypothetical protein
MVEQLTPIALAVFILLALLTSLLDAFRKAYN